MSLEQVTQAIHQHSTFCIPTHRNPEADAIRSSLALAHSLRQRGKECTMVSHDPIPRALQFLPYEGIFKNKPL